jgi:chromosome segregation ATPase
MPTRKKTSKKVKRKGNPAQRQVEQLRKSFKVLKTRLERETRARKIEARIKREAEMAGARLGKQLKALREQGKKLASELKSALNDAGKRDAARKEALTRIEKLKAQYAKTSAELKTELAQKTADLRRKSEELMKLAGDSAHRAVEIIRGQEHHDAPQAESSYPTGEQSVSEGHREAAPEDATDDEGTDKER